ncbi:uncharacterized protein LOC112045461 isoform X2 [Bicyclus anynana]|uniref:Uncharacterized protein LOC112045461 isoform X2 n=1 Tax=Bicyclus anynana TaxID=110368 RepID=A0A6J1MSB2_BICAN|nr:uncharacterized protein LOC112045461 isoform X2 [Bicyclus anynana]
MEYNEIEITLIPEGQENSNSNTAQELSDVYEGSNEPASISIATELCQEEPQSDDQDEMAEITKNEKSEHNTDLDKFKRRLIRVIARFMRNGEEPSERFWEDLTKQTDCNSKLLWDRMRALTIKKLRKLFIAEDTIDNITKIAQLTITDWLMFDLVVAHEPIDIIAQDLLDELEETPKILEDLFVTVVIYNIENLKGDELTRAWFQATKHYNGTKRKCSPILLQRRWYQLKARVREKFYQFWFRYRGSQNNLGEANQFKPSQLEMEIAKHFKYIITGRLPTWEALIEEQRVSLREDFERLQLDKRRIFRKETGPDLEVIEPHVETIDLEQFTDSEDSKDSTSVREPKQIVNLGIVKTEKIDEISDDDDVHILESMHIPLETNDNPESDSDLVDSNADVDLREEIPAADGTFDDTSTNSKQLSSVEAVENYPANTPHTDHAYILQSQKNTEVGVQDDNEILPVIVANTLKDCDMIMPKISSVSSAAIEDEERADDAVNNEVNDILKSVSENISSKNIFDVLPSPLRTYNTLSGNSNNRETPDLLVKQIIQDEINFKNYESHTSLKNKEDKLLHSFNEVPNDVNILDGIELEDDGIEYIDEDDDTADLPKTIKEEIEDVDCTNSPTIDLKLLLTPLVYTKKLDDMDIFRLIDFNSVKDKRIIENCDNDSKPVDKKSVKMEEISQERQSAFASDEFSDSASEYYSEVDDGPEVISLSSWLLRKPKNLSYNPIQLCKNPDFNTRLKRLSAGFFSSERNRHLLKECKPLTIDLHKSFEVKLCNNTLYLKGTTSTQNTTAGLEKNNEAIPIQSLINNVMNDILGPAPSSAEQLLNHQPVPHSQSTERKKVITLPDKDQMRLINEKLLTAEVTPIQASNKRPPVNIVPREYNRPVQSNTTDVISKATDFRKKLSTVICDDSYSTSISNQINLTTDSVIELTQYSKLNIISTGTVNKNSDPANLNQSYNINNNTKIINTNKSLNSLKTGYKALKRNLLNEQQKTGKKRVVVNHVELSWNPKRQKCMIPEDRLLTCDTVDKILNICKGEVEPSLTPSKSQKKINKALTRKALREKTKEERNFKDVALAKKVREINNDVSLIPNNNEVPFVSEPVPSDNLSTHASFDNLEKPSENVRIKTTVKMGKRQIYCCWAREKIVKLSESKKCLKKHNCPRPLCNCCCRIELVEKMTEIREGNNKPYQKEQTNQTVKETVTQPLIVTVSSAQNCNMMQNPTLTTRKVSVGVNTDYDMDFETSFAANLAKYKSDSTVSNDNYSASSIKISYPNYINQSHGQTQTLVNLMVLEKTANESNRSYNDYLKDKNVPVFIKKNNLSLSLNENNLINPKKNTMVLDINKPVFSITHSNSSNVIKNKNILIKNKAKIIHDKNNPPPLEFHKTPYLANLTSVRSDLLAENSDTSNIKKSDKVLFLTNDKMKNTFSRMPICLGKNKILLCSFASVDSKNQSNIGNISNNTNNNPISDDVAPLVALPDGVRIILLPNKELAVSIDPGIELDSKQLAYLPALMSSIQKQLAETNVINNVIKSNLDPLKNTDDSKDQDVTIVNSCNDMKLDDKKQADDENINSPVTLTCNEQVVYSTDNSTEIDCIKNNKDDCDNKDKDGRALDNSNVIDLIDNSDVNKKTILSDLMEMSGISAEDANVTQSPPKRKSESSPSPISEKLQSMVFNHNRKNLNMNNPLYENPVVQMALSRCPELCIIFSYQELRYASENNAQFYKMDIETGVIVPIEVVIKKQTPGHVSKQHGVSSKTVIDLTDDPGEDEIMNIEEQNAAQNDQAVPVKLYSSLKPNILRRQSLLLNSVSSAVNTAEPKKKKMIRVIKLKYKRKQPLTCVESINLDSDDDEPKEDASVDTSSEAIPEKTKSDDDSESDDEPLAFKAKRIKHSLVPNHSEEPNESLNRITENEDQKGVVDTQNVENVTGEVKEVPECATIDANFENLNDDCVNSTPLLEPVELGPLTFDDNVHESSEEDCILGV